MPGPSNFNGTGEPQEGMWAAYENSQNQAQNPNVSMAQALAPGSDWNSQFTPNQDGSFGINNGGTPESLGYAPAGPPGVWQSGSDLIQYMAPNQYSMNNTNEVYNGVQNLPPPQQMTSRDVVFDDPMRMSFALAGNRTPQSMGFESQGPGVWGRGHDVFQEIRPGHYQMSSTNNGALVGKGYSAPGYIMREGHVINPAVGQVDVERAGQMETASENRRGGQAFKDATGYPFGYVNITGAAYPLVTAGWPGQVENWARWGNDVT